MSANRSGQIMWVTVVVLAVALVAGLGLAGKAIGQQQPPQGQPGQMGQPGMGQPGMPGMGMPMMGPMMGPGGGTPALVVSGGSVYVASGQTGTIYRLNAETLELERKMTYEQRPMPPMPAGPPQQPNAQ